MDPGKDFFKKALEKGAGVIKYYTVKEAAKIFKRDIRTIHRWINEGFLREVTKVKDGYLIPETEIERILAQKAVPA